MSAAQRIRGDLDGSVFLHHPDGSATVLVAGDEVPDGLTVGDHLLEGAQPDAGSDGQDSGGAADTLAAPPAPAAPSAPAAPAAKKAAARKRATKKAAAKSTAKKATGR
jgi:hypothetical protein